LISRRLLFEVPDRRIAQGSKEQRRKERENFLSQIPLFAQLDEIDFEETCASLIERRYSRGTVLMEEGMPGDFMYVVWDGRVKVTQASSDGRERILDLLETGDFFGEAALIEDSLQLISVITLEPTRLLALSRITFLDLLSRSSELSLVVIRTLIARLRQANAQANSLCFEGVSERTSSVLERLARQDSADGAILETPPLTHQQIADMIGTSRETVTRSISQLKRRESLSQVGKRYRIHSG
jgi:CRP/FNR family transcriptional regulator